GNTPPVLRFEAGGTTFTGPPRGFAQVLKTKVADALPLTLWATDDGRIPPERAGLAALARGGAAGRGPVSWGQFRRPGEVTFENARPTVDAEGKSSTTAKFGAPGEYILRIQANDATGDGGGGFQCCWTNAHIKVSVN